MVKVQTRLSTVHSKLFTHVLGRLNHGLPENWQYRQPETPNSLLRAIKLWNIMPALLHSQDGREAAREVRVGRTR